MIPGIKGGGDKRLMGAEKRGIDKMVRKKKVPNKAADWKSRLLGREGGAKRGNITKWKRHFHGQHKAIKALMVFLIKII